VELAERAQWGWFGDAAAALPGRRTRVNFNPPSPANRVLEGGVCTLLQRRRPGSVPQSATTSQCTSSRAR